MNVNLASIRLVACWQTLVAAFQEAALALLRAAEAMSSWVGKGPGIEDPFAYEWPGKRTPQNQDNFCKTCSFQKFFGCFPLQLGQELIPGRIPGQGLCWDQGRGPFQTDRGSSTQTVVCSRPDYIFSIPTVGRVLSNQHYKMTQYLHIAATKPQTWTWSYYRQYDSIIVIKRHLENCLNFWVSKTGMPPPNPFLVIPPFSSRTWMPCERQQPRHCCMQRRMGAWSRRLPRSISWVCRYINPYTCSVSVFLFRSWVVGNSGKAGHSK